MFDVSPHGRVLDHRRPRRGLRQPRDHQRRRARSPSARCTTPRSSTSAARSRTTASSIASPTAIMMVVNASNAREGLRPHRARTPARFGVHAARTRATTWRSSPCRGRRPREILQSLTDIDLLDDQVLPLHRGRRSPAMRRSSAAPATPARTASSCTSTNDVRRAALERAHGHRPDHSRRARRARHAAPRDGDGALRQRHRRHRHSARGEPRLAREAAKGRLRRTRCARRSRRSRGSRASSSASRWPSATSRATAIPCSTTEQPSGVVCSGTISPTLGIPIGTCYLPIAGDEGRHHVRDRDPRQARAGDASTKPPFYKHASHL